MRRDFLILFLLPVVSMPQRENSLSTNACEAGAEIRSRATSGMTELYKLRLRGLGRSPSLENASGGNKTGFFSVHLLGQSFT